MYVILMLISLSMYYFARFTFVRRRYILNSNKIMTCKVSKIKKTKNKINIKNKSRR